MVAYEGHLEEMYGTGMKQRLLVTVAGALSRDKLF
jgi:hypothetical protein